MLTAQTVISQPPIERIVSINSTAFMSCQASVNRDNLDVVYQWLFNGRVIDIEKDYHYARVWRKL